MNQETLWEHFEAQANQRPDKIALAFPGAPDCSFGDLRARALKLAQALRQSGLARGDRIVHVAANGPWFIAWLLACAVTGAVLAPINVRLSRQKLEFVIRDAEPRLVICDEARASTLKSIDGVEPMLRVVGNGLHPLIGAAALHADPQGASADVVLQIYTSGTTGNPKGVLITNANVVAGIADCRPGLGNMSADDVVLVCLPLFHIAAILFTIFGLSAGAKLAMLPEIIAKDVLTTITQQKVTTCLLVPAVIRMLVNELEEADFDVSSLRTLVFGASAMPEELIAHTGKVFDADLYHVYGLSETSGIVTRLDPEEIVSGRRLRSCGKAFPPGEIGIFGPHGEKLPRGEFGEIAYKGPQTMLGYWRRPEATKLAIRDGWFFTGDGGILDSEGFLFIGDRLKDMVKSGGENAYPAEVENAVLRHPTVRDCAVIGLEDEKWGEAVVAVIVEQPGQAVELDTLREFCREFIAGFKLPRQLFKLSDLPRNGSGKVLKHVLRDQLVDNSRASAPA